MSFEVPDDRRYLESHEWVTTGGDTVRIGVSDFAQDELGDVVFVELPEAGDGSPPARRSASSSRSRPFRTCTHRCPARSSPSTRSCSIARSSSTRIRTGTGGCSKSNEPVEGGDAEGLLDADEYDDQIA